jgi:hypothetical protein
MQVMFAEDIGPWLAAAALLFGGLAASILALGALFPASRGNRSLTVGLIAPAIIMVILTTCWLAQGYFRRENHDHEEIIDNYVQPWFFMALAPLVTSVLAGFVLWFKRRKRV